MNGKNTKLLFVCPSFSSFIQNDLDILRRHFEVRVAHYQGKKRLLKFVIETLKGVMWADLTFSWFADVHAFAAVLFSKIFRRKSIVVVGGYEVAKVPEINYGAMLSTRKALIVRFVLKHADNVLTVDDSLKKDAIKNAKVDGRNIKTVPTGYDATKLKMNGEKENRVITVSYITDNIIKRKGLDTFVKAAEYLPDVEFVLIGKYTDDSIEYLKSIASPNVKFTGFIPDEDLIRYYQRAKGYCQLSRYEGLPNALCEAMLCGCVPVGTEYCGIPTAIGDTGFYVPYGDPKTTAKAIKEALKSDKGKEARERIKSMFPVERREKELIQIIKEMSK
jgi:glycosyltransferase involved in cell wall biosynthesis